MNAIRKEVRKRRAELINKQDHIFYFGCKGCPKRRAYRPSQKCRGCKVYRKLRSIGKELDQISRIRRWSRKNSRNGCKGENNEFKRLSIISSKNGSTTR